MRRVAFGCLALCFVARVAAAQFVQFPPPQIGAPAVTTAVAHKFVTAFPTPGSPLTLAQPDFTDLSGTLASAQCPNGTAIATGCLEVGGGLSVASGIVRVATLAGVAHQWVSSINSSGVPQLTQPTTGDISTSINALVLGNGSGLVAYGGSSCTNQFMTSLGVGGVAGCGSVVNADLSAGTFANITGTGTLGAGATGAGFTVALGASTITGVLGGANGGTGINNGSSTLTLAGNLVTTGTGATTLAFGSSTATFTFPPATDTLAGLGTANIFTQKQTLKLNTGSVPAIGTPIFNVAGVDGSSARSNWFAAGSFDVINMYRANGTLASSTGLVANDQIGVLAFGGWNTSAYVTGTAAIKAIATETWSGSVNGTEVAIQATPGGTNTAETEAVFSSGIASGTGVPMGVSTMNAPAGYWVGSTNVVSSSGAGNFPGGLSTVLSTGTPVASLCLDAGNNVIKKTTSGACI